MTLARGIATVGGAANADAQALAAEHLRTIDTDISALLAKDDVKLDAYSRAHLSETQARVRAVLDARLTLPRP